MLNRLRFEDLQLLRGVTKKIHMRYYPSELMTDREADRIIESFGELAVQNLLKKAVERGLRA